MATGGLTVQTETAAGCFLVFVSQPERESVLGRAVGLSTHTPSLAGQGQEDAQKPAAR